jgi:hypothetical protein
MKLTEIRKSLNEAAVPQKEVEKVKYWMEDAIPMVIDKDMFEKYDNSVENFFRYLEIQQGASPAESKKFAKAANDSIYELRLVISKFRSQIREFKQLDSQLYKIETIITAVESDLKKMK